MFDRAATRLDTSFDQVTEVLHKDESGDPAVRRRLIVALRRRAEAEVFETSVGHFVEGAARAASHGQPAIPSAPVAGAVRTSRTF